jgi:hypothetical protein
MGHMGQAMGQMGHMGHAMGQTGQTGQAHEFGRVHAQQLESTAGQSLHAATHAQQNSHLDWSIRAAGQNKSDNTSVTMYKSPEALAQHMFSSGGDAASLNGQHMHAGMLNHKKAIEKLMSQHKNVATNSKMAQHTFHQGLVTQKKAIETLDAEMGQHAVGLRSQKTAIQNLDKEIGGYASGLKSNKTAMKALDEKVQNSLQETSAQLRKMQIELGQQSKVLMKHAAGRSRSRSQGPQGQTQATTHTGTQAEVATVQKVQKELSTAEMKAQMMQMAKKLDMLTQLEAIENGQKLQPHTGGRVAKMRSQKNTSFDV